MPEQSYKNKHKLRRGVSLVEVVVAVAMLAIFAAIIFKSQWANDDLSLNNARNIVAINSARNSLKNLLLNDRSGQVESMFGVNHKNAFRPFTKCENLVASISFWKTGWGTSATSSLHFLESDLGLADKYGGDCGGQPMKFHDDNFELTNVVDLGSLATSVDVINNKIFVSLRSTVESEPDVAMVPVDSSENISYLNISMGTNKIDAMSGLVFAAQNSSSSQFVILDTDSNGLFVVSSSTLPTVSGARPEGVSIAYFDSKVYIGTKRTAGREFTIYDVSDAHNPVWLGNIEVNHNINDIEIKDGFAFLATSGNIRDMIVLDVSDPTNITQVATIDLPGNEDGRSVHVAGQSVFLGRYKSTTANRDELYMLEYSIDEQGNFAGAQLVDTIQAGADINSISLAGESIFAATKNPLSELQVFKITDYQGLVKIWTRDLPQSANGVDFENGTVAVIAGNALYIYQQNHE